MFTIAFPRCSSKFPQCSSSIVIILFNKPKRTATVPTARFKHKVQQVCETCEKSQLHVQGCHNVLKGVDGGEVGLPAAGRGFPLLSKTSISYHWLGQGLYLSNKASCSSYTLETLDFYSSFSSICGTIGNGSCRQQRLITTFVALLFHRIWLKGWLSESKEAENEQTANWFIEGRQKKKHP